MKMFKNVLLMLTLIFSADSSVFALTPKELNDQLIVAAAKGNSEAVKSRIAAGANVNAGDEYGRTPLFMATEKGHTDIVRILMAAGAAGHRDFKEIFVSAVFKGNTEMVKALLSADVSIDSDTLETAYMIALNRRNTEIVSIIKRLKS